MLIFCLACFRAVLHCPWLCEKLSWLRLAGLMQLVTRLLSVFYWRSVIQAGLLSPPMSGTGLPSPVLSQEPARLGLVFKCIVCDFLAANPFFSVLASSPALPEIQRKSPVFSLLHNAKQCARASCRFPTSLNQLCLGCLRTPASATRVALAQLESCSIEVGSKKRATVVAPCFFPFELWLNWWSSRNQPLQGCLAVHRGCRLVQRTE